MSPPMPAGARVCAFGRRRVRQPTSQLRIAGLSRRIAECCLIARHDHGFMMDKGNLLPPIADQPSIEKG